MRKIYSFLLLATHLCLLSQEKAGIANSNYLSTTSIFLNPSSSVDSRTYMQLNLGAGYAFGMNNIGYIPKFSFWEPLKTYLKTQTITVEPQVSTLKWNKFMYGYGSIDGPVFVMSKRNYGIGFFVRGRSVVEGNGTPYNLTNILLGRKLVTINGSEDINVNKARFGDMTWFEAGGNFGIMALRHQNHMITVGGNLKYIRAINLIYGHVTNLVADQSDTAVDIQSVKAKIRFTENDLKAGNGMGLDIGITYKKMLGPVETYNAHSTQSNCQYVDYKYKIGVSLRDLGYVRFKKNTTLADINGSGYFYTNKDEAYYRSTLGPDLNAPFQHRPFLASLPSNLSVQFDYNFGYNFYFNATAVQSILPSRFTGVQSHNLIVFCPRYETKVFEASMPVIFHRYLYPQLGLAFRVRTFTLGFDNMFPLFFKKTTYGVGIYASVGVSLFKNPACKTKPLRVDDCPPGMKEKARWKRIFKKKTPKKA
jgi:hypothetical protein